MTNPTFPLTAADVEFTLECLPEDAPVCGNAMASGDDRADKECEDAILSDLDNGNEWAWCCVKVTAKWQRWTGADYLGCCSYASREQFETGVYYDDMKAQALQALNDAIQADSDALRPLRIGVGE